MAALVRPCQWVYTCGSRWTFAHLLRCIGGIAGYASAETMAIDGCDGRGPVEILGRKPGMERTNVRLLIDRLPNAAPRVGEKSIWISTQP